MIKIMAYNFFVIVPSSLDKYLFRYDAGDTFQTVIEQLKSLGAPTTLTYYNGVQCFKLDSEREIISCFPLRQSQVLIFASDEELGFNIIEKNSDQILMMILDDNLLDVIILDYIDLNEKLKDIVDADSKLTFRLGLAQLDPSTWKYYDKPMKDILFERVDQILCLLNEPDQIQIPENMNHGELLMEAARTGDVELVNVAYNKEYDIDYDLVKIYNRVFDMAIENGFLDVLNAIIDNKIIRYEHGVGNGIRSIIAKAAELNRIDIIKEMLKRLTPYSKRSDEDLLKLTLFEAEQSGNIEIAEILSEYLIDNFGELSPGSPKLIINKPQTIMRRPTPELMI